MRFGSGWFGCKHVGFVDVVEYLVDCLVSDLCLVRVQH